MGARRGDRDAIRVGAESNVQEGKVIPPHSLVVGVPAKVLRPLNEEQRGRVERGYLTYVALKERYRDGV